MGGPTEQQVRELLTAHRRTTRPGEPALLVAELPIGGTRADHAVLTADMIELVEVKTEKDTVGRLARQAGLYSAVADRCGLAVAPRHAEKAAALVPGWWAVTTVDADGLQSVREGADNPAPDPVATAKLLWRAELAEAVAEVGQTRGTAGIDRDGLAAVLAAALRDEPDRLRAIVRAGLLARTWVGDAPGSGPVRVVAPTKPSWKNKRRGRIRAHDRARRS